MSKNEHKKLVVGLGNPGREYEGTRHNAGYMFLDYIQKQISKSKFLSSKQIQNYKFKKTNIFMNNSGAAVRRLIDHYSLDINHLFVAHDDLDLALGNFKVQRGKGPKDHKGILSVDEALGTKDYWRIRIGIDARSAGNRVDGEAYTLQKFSAGELEILRNTFQKIYAEL